eukprot:6922810-Prymnesium_polylepis.1
MFNLCECVGASPSAFGFARALVDVVEAYASMRDDGRSRLCTLAPLRPSGSGGNVQLRLTCAKYAKYAKYPKYAKYGVRFGDAKAKREEGLSHFSVGGSYSDERKGNAMHNQWSAM